MKGLVSASMQDTLVYTKKNDLHDVLGLPDDGVSVEVSSGVEPEVELLLSVPFALGKDVCVENVGVTAHVPQELEIYLIMSWPLWW